MAVCKLKRGTTSEASGDVPRLLPCCRFLVTCTLKFAVSAKALGAFGVEAGGGRDGGSSRNLCAAAGERRVGGERGFR